MVNAARQYFHNAATKNASYMNQMDPKNWPRWVVLELERVLPSGSTIFEYGVGQGTNSIYLAGKGFNVEAQDISSEMIVELLRHATKAQVRLNVHCSEAQDHTLSKSYNAFVSTYILHFLPPADAMRVLRNMQASTIFGGYNALEFFTPMTWMTRSDRFYPTLERLLDIYSGWSVNSSDIWTVLDSKNGLVGHGKLLLQKS